MKKLLFFSILAITMIAVSCEDDKATATIPVLGKLTLAPDTVYQGSQIKATIKIADEGTNSDLKKFTVSYNATTFSVTSFSRDSANNIFFGFTAPNVNGKLYVSITGTASVYAGDALYKTTNTVNSTVIIRER